MSADKKIKKQIEKELNVPIQPINSALVSAQLRNRFYCHNIPNVELPVDKGIVINDILEYGCDLTCGQKSYCLTASYNGAIPQNTIERKQRNMVAVKVGNIGDNSQGMRVYSPYAKGICLCANGGGGGAKTGLYLVPIDYSNKMTLNKYIHIYQVYNGNIFVNGISYPTLLEDGYYIIRKLTVLEAKRLQTVPDDYIMPCSENQNYKMLGNGWTVDVIIHILSHIPNIFNDDVVVLSMYDGMSCGQIALKKMGVKVIKYFATEIDKYCIETTQTNFPNTIQLGDAMYVRSDLFWYKLNDIMSCNYS